MNHRPAPRTGRAVFALSVGVAGLIGAMSSAWADTAPFELIGPDLQVDVTRGDRTLPIAKVPSLAVGDKIVVHGAMPEDQGAHFLLVSAFLRGATSPPPKDWMDMAETWKSKEKDKALSLVVPKGARQMVLLMVPQTGGAEGVLVDAVRGKPGEFVRASQDLNQASLDHSRLNTFMAAIQAQGDSGPEALRIVAPVLARSLSIKLQEDCLSKLIEQQASCLVQNQDTLVLGDVHSSSLADTLTGTPTDLALQLSATREGGAGYYSAYIGVARDIARIFGAFNNPQFNYLPTLTVRRDDTMSLLLNAAPSFKKPKSVMVTALPAIEADIPPQLRSTAKGPICVTGSGAVLPVEGAPLIYSTAFAHTMMARLTAASGKTLDVPVTARADKGGYVLGDSPLSGEFTGSVRAHLHGSWGFAPFDGPDFLLERPATAGTWKVAGDAQSLVVGRENEIVLEGAAPSCVENVLVRRAGGTAHPAKWSAQSGGRLAVTVPLDGVPPGDLTLEVRSRGGGDAAAVPLTARVQASKLDGLELHAGDTRAVLTGQRLDQVRSVSLDGVTFAPDGLSREGSIDRLQLVAQAAGKVPAQGAAARATVVLQDGRSLPLNAEVGQARVQATLLGRTVYPGPPTPGTRPLDFGTGDVLPNTGEIVFSIKVGAGGALAPQDVIEVATASGDVVARLSVGKGLAQQNAEVAVATLKAADLPAGTYGPLRFRLVATGQDQLLADWQPLTTVARLPQIESVTCAAKAASCTLTGRNLFLIAAIGADSALAKAADVPVGFTGATLPTPTPMDGALYVRLRDAPASTVTLRVR